MRRILGLLIMTCAGAAAQPNCNVYKMNGNEPCYEACMMATDDRAGQGARASQQLFDKAIALCPDFDYAYAEKAVPYLKRGDFVTWRKLIDKAVAINPAAHLGYRGWCRYQFVRDYRGAIADFERLDSLVTYDLGYSVNGDYQLNVARALCYKALGQKTKALQILEAQLASPGYSPMPYDYLHLGVLMMELGDKAGALANLNKSIAQGDYLAEPHYYLGLIYKSMGRTNEFQEHMLKARSLYEKGLRRFDPYTQPMDKVYAADIDRELRAKPANPE